MNCSQLVGGAGGTLLDAFDRVHLWNRSPRHTNAFPANKYCLKDIPIAGLSFKSPTSFTHSFRQIGLLPSFPTAPSEPYNFLIL